MRDAQHIDMMAEHIDIMVEHTAYRHHGRAQTNMRDAKHTTSWQSTQHHEGCKAQRHKGTVKEKGMGHY